MKNEPVSIKPIKDLVEAMEGMMDELPENLRKHARELREALDSGGSRAKLFTLTLELLSKDTFKDDTALKALLDTFNQDLHQAVASSGLKLPIGDDFDADSAANRFLRGFAELVMATTYGERRAVMNRLSGPDRVTIVDREATKGLAGPIVACLVAMDECVVKMAGVIEEAWDTMDRAVEDAKKQQKNSATEKKDS